MRLYLPLFLAMAMLFTGCSASRLAPLETIPNADRQATIFYLRPEKGLLNAIVGKDVELYQTTLEGDEPVPVSSGLRQGGPLASYEVLPGVSSSGRYVALLKEPLGRLGVDTNSMGRRVRITLTDIEKDSVVLEFEMDKQRMRYVDELPYHIHWAPDQDAFYVAERDTVKKRWPDGRVEVAVSAPRLRTFAVAPDEASVLLVHDDILSFHSIADGSRKEVMRLKSKAFGLAERYVRGGAWGADGRVAFTEGSQVYIYDPEDGTIEEHRAGQEVFDLVWLSPDELLLVEGQYPSDISALQSQRSYRLVRLALGTGEATRLYGSINHEPLSVKPRLSPSNQLILFAERRFDDSNYRVKVLSLDGMQIRELDDGIFPVWR